MYCDNSESLKDGWQSDRKPIHRFILTDKPDALFISRPSGVAERQRQMGDGMVWHIESGDQG